MKEIEHPVLYHKSKSGSMTEWKVWTEGATIFTEWGQINGAKQIAKKICEAKNIGRANATTPEQQAKLEAASMWKHQLDRKYRLTIQEAEGEIFLPMKARQKLFQWGGMEKKLRFPVDVQPKFDGVRCLAAWNEDETEVEITSLSGIIWSVPRHIARQLEMFLPKRSVLDGELYVHGVGFQTITKWVKKLYPETSQVQFYVYDCPEHNGVTKQPWSIRKQNLEAILTAKPIEATHIILVGSFPAYSEKEIKEKSGYFVEQGYEGGIVRFMEGRYEYATRSNEVLKIKDFIDAEYKIVGAETGDKGTKEENAVVWVCEDPEKGTFTVRPKGTIASRERDYKNAKSFFGKMYKVKFFEFTDAGLPRFPVGLGVRDEMDMSK